VWVAGRRQAADAVAVLAEAGWPAHQADPA
jgi:hypothetical protein